MGAASHLCGSTTAESARSLIAGTLADAERGGRGLGATNADWAAAVLYNGLARYEQAMAAAERATSATFEPFVSVWALPELIEAAARTGHREQAHDALRRLAETTQPCATDSALGIEARCRGGRSSFPSLLSRPSNISAEPRSRCDSLPGVDGWRNDLVFAGPIGGPLPPGSVTRRFEALIARAGLGRWRFHDLRHAAATVMLAQGVELRVISEMLGHSSLGMGSTR
jgi:hypothetical protein